MNFQTNAITFTHAQDFSRYHAKQAASTEDEQQPYSQMCMRVLSLVAQEPNPVRQARLIARTASAIGKGTAVIFMLHNLKILTPLAIIHSHDAVSEYDNAAFSASSSGLTIPENAPTIMLEEGIAGKAAKYNQSILFPEPGSLPQFHIESVALDAAFCPEPVQVFYAIPITYQQTVVGVIELLQPHPAAGLSPQAKNALHSLSDQAALLFALSMREMQANQTQPSPMHSMEETFQILARRLRKGPMDGMQSMLKMTEHLDTVVLTDTFNARQVIRALHEELLQAAREIVQATFDLTPNWLETASLATSLQTLAAEILGRSVIQYEFVNALDSEPALPYQSAIYSIVREAFYNMLEHANATVCRIAVREVDGQLCIQVLDNGHGFDVDTVLAQYATGKMGGLYLMYESAKQIGGNLRIASSANHGTHIELLLPWNI